MSRIFFLLPLVLLGCDSLVEPRSPGGISLVPVEETYEQGETAEARLINGSGEPIGYNLCLAMWDYRVADRWERVAPLRMCNRALYILQPGAEVVLRETVDSWQPGSYRFVLDVILMETDGNSATVTSSPFAIEG